MHIMRRQLSFCTVLLPHHPQHHLRSFHQIGSAVHAAFLYVSVRLFKTAFASLISSCSLPLRFAGTALRCRRRLSIFCTIISTVSISSWTFNGIATDRQPLPPYSSRTCREASKSSSNPSGRFSASSVNIISGRRQPHRTIPSRSPSAWLIAAAPVVQTATTWCPLRTRTLFTFPASSLLEKATIMPVNGPHLSSLPDSRRLWL